MRQETLGPRDAGRRRADARIGVSDIEATYRSAAGAIQATECASPVEFEKRYRIKAADAELIQRDVTFQRRGNFKRVGSAAIGGWKRPSETSRRYTTSWDIAVWDGPRPANDADATRVFEDLWEQEERQPGPASERLLAYVRDLTARYPDLTELDDDDLDASPWADGPLSNNVSGPLFYFSVVSSAVGDVLPFVAATARSHGLVCFDPQSARLI